MSSITCCTMTQQVLWGYMPTVFCGGSDILGICCDPFRSWTREPGKSEQMMEASLYACVYFYTVISLLREVRILEKPCVLDLCQKPVWSVFKSRQLILNMVDRIQIRNLRCIIAGSTYTHRWLYLFIYKILFI